LGFSRWAGARPARFVRDLKCARSHWCGISLPPRPFCALPSGGAPVGPVAQRLEPAAHNGLVAGSSPARPTNHSRESPLSRIGDFGRPIMGSSGAGWDFGLSASQFGRGGREDAPVLPGDSSGSGVCGGTRKRPIFETPETGSKGLINAGAPAARGRSDLAGSGRQKGHDPAHPQTRLLRCGDLVVNALAPDLALELGEGQQHVEGQPSHAGRRIEGLGDGDEGDVQRC
jgi:hypothetical protein